MEQIMANIRNQLKQGEKKQNTLLSLKAFWFFFFHSHTGEILYITYKFHSKNLKKQSNDRCTSVMLD